MSKLNLEKKSTKKSDHQHHIINTVSEGGFILIITCALFTLLSLFSYSSTDLGPTNIIIANAGGQVGAYIADTLYWLLGYMAYIFPCCVAYVGKLLLHNYYGLPKQASNKFLLILRGCGLYFLMISSCGLLNLEFQGMTVNGRHYFGGSLGYYVALGFSYALNPQGAYLLLVALLLIGITWFTGISWLQVTEHLGRYTLLGVRYVTRSGQFIIRLGKSIDLKLSRPPQPKIIKKPKPPTKEIFKEVPAIDYSKKITPKTDNAVNAINTINTLPALELLDKGEPGKALGGYTHQELEKTSREVEQYLLDFGIQANVVAVHPGPVITRFELQLAAGIKVSRLSSLAKDLARSLSVISVRVVEVIPGKAVVGLELPNQYRQVVRLSQVLSTDHYQQASSPITLALGVDIAGSPMIVDLAKMPHLLVAGTTGSGKSVGINAMILSILLKSTPQQVRLILIDPKMLELSVYDGIPHLLTPVVTDMKEAASTLRWCVAEMERRYKLMATLGVRNLAGFNLKVSDSAESLPYIVVVIDELADMMMVVGKKVEQLIARIAQKARAAGIHLILATQRPSVDVLTGLIKSNIPTRVSFQVSSKIDSRTILDQQGAESLLGHGDMLYLAPGTGAPLRVHGAFIDDKEVHRIADDWRARGAPDYIENITKITSDSEFDEVDGMIRLLNLLYKPAKRVFLVCNAVLKLAIIAPLD